MIHIPETQFETGRQLIKRLRVIVYKAKKEFWDRRVKDLVLFKQSNVQAECTGGRHDAKGSRQKKGQERVQG
jgi:hypothetical protein